MTKILDGKIVRDKIAQKLKAEISRLRSKPKLVIIQVGNLEESNTYIRQKVLFGQKIGAIVDHKKLPENISQEKLITQISSLNTDRKVTGIIVQMPIPDRLDKDKIVNTVSPVKDVDGQTATNIKLLFEGTSSSRHPELLTPVILSPSIVTLSEAKSLRVNSAKDLNSVRDKLRGGSQDSSVASLSQNDNRVFSGYTPATTKGILTLLDYYKVAVSGKHVVVVGRSSLVGKPTALALINRDATVTICHSKTRNLREETRNCDILIVAAGKPKLITKDYVFKGQVVIDVGINIVNYSSSGAQAESRSSRQARTITNTIVKPESEIPSRRLVGDVDFESVAKIVKAISPVPGGCGPMTVASLFENLLIAYRRQLS